MYHCSCTRLKRLWPRESKCGIVAKVGILGQFTFRVKEFPPWIDYLPHDEPAHVSLNPFKLCIIHLTTRKIETVKPVLLQ